MPKGPGGNKGQVLPTAGASATIAPVVGSAPTLHPRWRRCHRRGQTHLRPVVRLGASPRNYRYSPAPMFVGLLKTMRPHQWVKNGFVLAPLVFAQELFDVPRAVMALGGFGLFCLASSTVYILNDLTDLSADRSHPIKSKRPIASGRVPVGLARATATIFALLVMGLGFFLNVHFGVAIVAYLVVNFAYSMRLKRVAYLDVLCITAGFELRVLAGAFAAEVPPSAYLLIVTFLLATFLAFGKRMHELLQGERAYVQRKALGSYDLKTSTCCSTLRGSRPSSRTLCTRSILPPEATSIPHTFPDHGDACLWRVSLPPFGPGQEGLRESHRGHASGLALSSQPTLVGCCGNRCDLSGAPTHLTVRLAASSRPLQAGRLK